MPRNERPMWYGEDDEDDDDDDVGNADGWRRKEEKLFTQIF